MQLQEQFSEPVIDQAAITKKAEILNAPDNELQIRVQIVDVLSDYLVAGMLLGFTPGEVSILVKEPLSEQREVEVRLHTFSFVGQTLYCRPSGSQYEAHVSIDDTEGAGLRKTPRFPVMIAAELLLPNADPVAITIRDLSRDGMGIESPILLKAGQPIAIVSGPAFVFAVVRHCRDLSAGKFRAGVEMHHLFEKPPQSPIGPLQRASHSTLLQKVTSRLFSMRVSPEAESPSEVRKLGITQVEP